MYTDEYEQHSKHVENKGSNCPNCKSDYLKRQDLGPMVNGTKKQKVTCDTCGATWTDTFVLTGFTDLKPGVPAHFRVLISRLADRRYWRVTSDPKWLHDEIACSKILLNEPNKYAEYQNCGVVHRMIRAEDAAQYGIDYINPEWALNPEDIA